jgi:hypothetical protein
MLFSTHHGTEMFEFMNAVEANPPQLKELLLKNVDAIFDDDAKAWVRQQIEAYRVD